ncbi:hypothetical protein [Curtobacterium sp. MCSS17_008]|uniref:hypothetical protein n=1 Tax=Curtobacterium sp. MCSS17_008 TaxID=2175647 RepID=UPI0011B4619F|nr:hypothetical protein [Curtobacterium sp. MCSS17_008]
MTDIASEQSKTAALDVTTPAQRSLQQRTTSAIDRVAVDVSAARAALQEGSPDRLLQAEDRMRSAVDVADAWSTRLGKGAP